MATLKYCEDGTLISSKFTNQLKSIPGMGIVEIVFDCSKKYSATAGSYAAIAATDIVELLAVPAGTRILEASCTVLVPATAASTASLGDGTSGAGFMALSAINAAVGTKYGVQYGTAAGDALGFALAGGRLYTPAVSPDATPETFDITFAAQVPTPAVLRIELLVVRYNTSVSVNTMY